jgi:pimeloyl-ACP methyl ester carboxylesterase
VAFHVKFTKSIRLVFLCLVYSLLGYSSESVASFNISFKFPQAQPKDTQPPVIAITSPESVGGVVFKPLQVLPEFKGTAVDNPQTNPSVPASGLAEVRASIGVTTSGGIRYWNGTSWVLVSSPAQIPYFPAQINGTNWTLKITPKLYTAPDGGSPYVIVFEAIDRADNKSLAGLLINIKPLEINVIDAYLGVKKGIDFTSSLKQEDLKTLAELAKLPENTIKRASLDGTTKLVVVAKGNSPVQASFDKQYSEAQGLLDDVLVDASSLGTTSKLQPHTTLDGEYYWFAIYTVPSRFTSQKAPDIKFKIWHFDGTNDYPELSSSTDIHFAPVPVLFVHGLWSDKNTWKSAEFNIPGVPENLRGPIPLLVVSRWGDVFSDTLNASKAVGLVDYGNTSAAHFEVNKNVLLVNQGDNINSILEAYRKTSTACTKVDVVAHSMGGILTRLFYQQPFYRNKENYNQGYIRRLVTIGTPHLGSPIADVAWNKIVNGIGPCSLLRDKIESEAGPLGEGAIEDLRVCSIELRMVADTNVSVYAITASDNTLDGRLRTLNTVVRSCNWGSRPFGNEPNDGIVSVNSQRGGLATGTLITPVADTDHLQETTSIQIASIVADLLSGNGAIFAPRMPGVLGVCQNESNIPLSDLDEYAQVASQSLSVRITSPSEGALFRPGDEVTIVVSPQEGRTISFVAIFAGIGRGLVQSELIELPPYMVKFKIPLPYLGAYPIAVMARDSNGNEAYAEINTIVQSNAQLQRIEVSPSSVSLSSKGSFKRLEVSGQFSDGVKRDLTTKTTGTTYVSDNANVVQVSENGVITAVDQGSAIVRVTNQNQSVDIPVNVQFEVPFVEQISLPEVALGETAKDLTIFGKHLGGTTKVEFFLNGILDPNVTATITSIDSPGVYSAVQAKITVATGAALGKRAVVVTTPGGVSERQTLLKNALTIVPRASRTIGPPREPIKRGDGRRIQ